LEEVTSLSDKLYVSNYNIDENPLLAQRYNVQLIPGLIIVSRDQDKFLDYGIRFAGFPSRYEFSSFLQAIIQFSSHDSGLIPADRNQLNDIKKPGQLHVFVIPT
jgi:alkyl hydroperoxide reductase subunit AhpF